MIFTDEQMIEIGRIRERLEKLRNKTQPYPSLSEKPQPNILHRGLTSKERDEFSQMKAHILFLEKKLITHLDKKRPKKDTY